VLTPAKTYESEVADALILGDEWAVYADKAYEKRTRREALKARGVKDRIQHRRTRGQRELPHWQTVRNKLIGRIRSAVERTFSVLKRRYGFSPFSPSKPKTSSRLKQSLSQRSRESGNDEEGWFQSG